MPYQAVRTSDLAFTSTGRNFTVATHYIEISVPDAPVTFIQARGDGVAVATITFETTGFTWAASDSTTAGHWNDENDVTDISIAAVVGSMGLRHAGNNGAPRARLKIVVSTAGTLQLAAGGKIA
jgi:hypothetical protein